MWRILTREMRGMEKEIALGLVFLLLPALAGTVSAANLVANGGFETPKPLVGVSTIFVSNSDGWNMNHINIIRTYWKSAEGSQSIALSTHGSVSQTIPTTPGNLYNLSFALAGSPNSGTKHLEVFWGGESQGTYTFDTTGKTQNNMGWIYVHISNLIARSETTEIKFTTLDNNFDGPALDDIVVDDFTNDISVLIISGLVLAAVLIIAGALLLKRGEPTEIQDYEENYQEKEGHGYLKVENGSGHEARVVLAWRSNNSIYTGTRIQSGGADEILGIPPGEFWLYFSLELEGGNIGRFKFSDPLRFKSNGRYRVTLHPVSGGTARIESVSAEKFP
jgi:hypothetical protein